MPNNLKESYETLKIAFLKLKEFVETDEGTEKDRGAIINAYQYTFELWWKTLQKYLQQKEILEELGPSSTIRTAIQYEFIEDKQEFMDMLRDRNLITHTYKEDTASYIYERIKNVYVYLLQKFIKEFDKKII